MSTSINDAVTIHSMITVAESPFDGVNAQADIILRSSDHVDFHVLKAFLIFSSPVFEGMFTIEQPLDGGLEENKAGLPVIPMEEKGETLRMLLLLCYPGYSPVLEKLDDFLAVHASASKYCMEAVEKLIEAAFLSSTLMEQEPLRIFAIAVRRRWEVVARAAARNTLAVTVYGRSHVEELEFIDGLEYHQLLDYHWKCGGAASELAKNFGWITRRHFVWFRECDSYHDSDEHSGDCSEDYLRVGVGAEGRGYFARKWWLDYMSQVRADLALRPRGITVTEPAIVNKALEKAITCGVCRKQVAPQMKEFIAMFMAEVERVISKIVLDVEF